jgi:hypothetical protein
MKNIFNPVYREDYLEGYASGHNPYITISENKNEAYKFGFEQGRIEYERSVSYTHLRAHETEL